MNSSTPPSPHQEPLIPVLEEDGFAWYNPKDYYAVRTGEVFQSRYQVVGKLGYGAVSTAWLCRDLHEHKYVTLKVFAIKNRQAENEEKVLAHIAAIDQTHIGSRLVRKLLNSFEVPGQNGTHRCLVHEPLIITLGDLGPHFPGFRVPLHILRTIVHDLLNALDFLHSKAKVVHTDISPDNIMMSAIDQSMFKQFEDEERAKPSARKTDGDHVIYASRGVEIPDDAGLFMLCDLGEARVGQKEYIGEVMPDLYRAPELVLGTPWTKKIDIWSAGVLIWNLLEGTSLFKNQFLSREQSTRLQIARMIALLGPPPKDLLKRGTLTKRFFDEDGKFKASNDIANTSFEAEENVLHGEEKVKFLAFLRRMLRWRPKERASARELLEDPWMTDFLDEEVSSE